jgi:hypothetical protein
VAHPREPPVRIHRLELRREGCADIDPWVTANGITYDVAIDPTPPGSDVPELGTVSAIPTALVVDPRTMKVTQVIVGANDTSQNLQALDAQLVSNGAQPVAAPDAAAD